jgi:phosphatidate phosphatase PAH1
MEALLPGTSDTIVVKHKSGKYKSTPFLACFGPYTVANKSKHVNIYINNKLIP